MLTQPPAASSVLALVTTVHLGLTALRSHRASSATPVNPLAVVSLTLAGLPWIFPSVPGLAFGLLVHLVWFATCEWLAPEAPAATPARAPAPPSPPPADGRHAPASPHRVASQAPLERPQGFVRAPVLALFDETPLVKTIRIARPDGFDYIAGQFITVRVRIEGKEFARCYSISSAPDVAGYLEISVKRQGAVSNALHATLRPGAMLSVRKPAGAFRYPSEDDRPILLLAAGIGITPLMSMLRHAVAREPTRPVKLLYGAHTEADFAFRDELALLAGRHPQIRVILAASDARERTDIYPGRLDERLLQAAVPDLAHSIAFICGPKAMIDDMRGLLSRLGVPAPQIRHEVFQAAVAAAGGVPSTRPRPARPLAHTMRCTRAGRQIAIQPGQTLLDAAEAGGLAPDSLCRAGVCGTCRVVVAAGDVNCESATLDPSEREQGFVLACVTTAQSDCVVEL